MNLVGRKGSALLSSTHHQNTEDLLREHTATNDSEELWSANMHGH